MMVLPSTVDGCTDGAFTCASLVGGRGRACTASCISRAAFPAAATMSAAATSAATATLAALATIRALARNLTLLLSARLHAGTWLAAR